MLARALHYEGDMQDYVFQIPLEEPVTKKIQIGCHTQNNIYEGEGFLCNMCGRLGHTQNGCLYVKIPTQPIVNNPTNDSAKNN